MLFKLEKKILPKRGKKEILYEVKKKTAVPCKISYQQGAIFRV